MAIKHTIERIIVGPVSRLELTDPNETIELGPTMTEVIVKREVQQIDIMSDYGITLGKVRGLDKMSVEVNLTENPLRILQIAWGGAKPESSGFGTRKTNLYRASTSKREKTWELTIEGPGVDGTYRRYIFQKVITTAQTSQVLAKAQTTSVPISFEVLGQFTTDDEVIFGTIEDIGTPNTETTP